MLRKLLLSALLLPLLINGLWIVCNDSSGPSSEALPDASSGLTQEQIDCIRICAMKHGLGDSTICLVLPGDAKSITIVDFGVAILPAQVKLEPIAIAENSSTDFPVIYEAPVLFSATPPPRA